MSRYGADGAAHRAAPSAAGSAIGNGLTWLGGGSGHAATDAHERSAYQITGLIVALTGLLAWLVAAVAMAGSTDAPLVLVIGFTLVVGLLVGAVARTLAAGRPASWYGIAARAGVALFIGVILGELAAIGIFGGSIDRELDRQAVQQTVEAPGVIAATSTLDNLRAERGRLDSAVDAARDRQTQAYERAACEYNPQPSCSLPVTGDPGAGPQTDDANQIYDDATAALTLAETNRSQQAPSLDADIAGAEQAVADAKAAAPEHVDRGISGRWTAMHDYTLANLGALVLRLLTIAFFAVLMLLPLLLKLWRGETTLDRSTVADSIRKQAELDAQTRIAVERAAARVEAEKVWTEQKLTSARFAAEAETAIEREQQRRRVVAAFDDSPTQIIPAALDFMPAAALPSGRHQMPESTPIADAVEAEIAEAETVSHDEPDLDYAPGRRELVPARASTVPARVEKLPAVAETRPAEPHRAAPVKPQSVGLPKLNPIPDLTRAVTGIVRPLVPDVVNRIGSINPLRSARQRFEEFEEIKFTISRKRTVTVDSDTPEETATYREVTERVETPAAPALTRIHTSRVVDPAQPRHYDSLDYQPRSYSALDAPAPDDWSRSLTEREGYRELVERDGPAALDERRGPRELPPGS